MPCLEGVATYEAAAAEVVGMMLKTIAEGMASSKALKLRDKASFKTQIGQWVGSERQAMLQVIEYGDIKQKSTTNKILDVEFLARFVPQWDVLNIHLATSTAPEQWMFLKLLHWEIGILIAAILELTGAEISSSSPVNCDGVRNVMLGAWNLSTALYEALNNVSVEVAAKQMLLSFMIKRFKELGVRVFLNPSPTLRAVPEPDKKHKLELTPNKGTLVYIADYNHLPNNGAHFASSRSHDNAGQQRQSTETGNASGTTGNGGTNGGKEKDVGSEEIREITVSGSKRRAPDTGKKDTDRGRLFERAEDLLITALSVAHALKITPKDVKWTKAFKRFLDSTPISTFLKSVLPHRSGGGPLVERLKNLTKANASGSGSGTYGSGINRNCKALTDNLEGAGVEQLKGLKGTVGEANLWELQWEKAVTSLSVASADAVQKEFLVEVGAWVGGVVRMMNSPSTGSALAFFTASEWGKTLKAAISVSRPEKRLRATDTVLEALNNEIVENEES